MSHRGGLLCPPQGDLVLSHAVSQPVIRYPRAHVAAMVVVALVASLLSAFVIALPARAAQIVALEAFTDTPTLAGEQGSLRLAVSNPTGEAWFNMAVAATVPAGVSLADGGAILGVTPVAYTSADDSTIPAGVTRYVWEDIVDLPAGAAFSAEVGLTVAQPVFDDSGSATTNDEALHPVGSDFDISVTAYTSTDPRLLPWFAGSSANDPTASEAVTHSSPVRTPTTEITSLRVTKTEPSPEAELLRGVHDFATTYTIQVENTTQGSTNDVTVTDYLPAGLEFLGNGQADYSANEEYPGAGPISHAAPAGYRTPQTIDTIVADAALAAERGLVEGAVYTAVTWVLDLEPGEIAQIPYLAGIPLYENALFDGTAPSPESLEQAPNLDNNTGASTRHSDEGTPATDGNTLTNVATATGQYQGVVRTGADRTATDADDETVFAMDVRVLKSANRETFAAGEEVTYTLDIAASEYTDASQIELIDRLEDGLCPIVPTGTDVRTGTIEVPTLGGGVETFTGAPVSEFPATCELVPAAPSVAGLQWIAFDADSGLFYAGFTIDTIPAGNDAQVQYTARMRTSYTEDGSGNTSSTDAVVNSVIMTGATDPTPAVAEVTGPGTESVADDSEAVLTSRPDSISKRVLPSDVPLASGDDVCAVDQALYSDTLAGGFVQGDTVCYELRVNFSADADSRNPIITDVLPAGVFVDPADIRASVVVPGDGTTTLDPDQWQVDGDRVVIEPASDVIDGDRFVRRGSILIVHIAGTVEQFSVDPLSLDKHENLMKFQQENVDAVITFARTQADIEVQAGLQLSKGIAGVNGDTVDGAAGCDGTLPDCDSVQVAQGDRVGYRIDLSGGPTSVTDPTLVGATYAVSDVVVWDRLPDAIQQLINVDSAVISELDVDASDDGELLLSGDPGYPDDAPDDQPALVVWQGVGAAANEVRTLTYDLTIPVGLLIDTDHVNTASIIAYAVGANGGGQTSIRPDGSLSTAESNAPGEGTRDTSDVHLPAASIDKQLVTTEIGALTSDIDTLNTNAVIVQGERATFRYSVTIPAHTSVENGVLSDGGVLHIGSATGTVAGTTLVGSTTAKPAGVADDDWDDFVFDAATGALSFPDLYTNNTDADQVFSIDLTLWVTDRDASNPLRNPNIANNATLFNTATFESDSWDGSDSATVQYREPNLQINKSADPASDVSIGSPVEYELRVTNTNRVKAYDVEVIDTVPEGLIVDAATISGGGVLTGVDPATGGGTITWQIAEVPATATLIYEASIDPDTGGGQSYENVADVTGYTLPATLDGDDTTARRGDRVDTDEQVITATTAGIVKGVLVGAGAYGESATAPIGETAEYSVEVTLQPNINYYDPVIRDVLPEGAALVEASVSGPDETSATDTITGEWARSYDAGSRTWSWAYDGDIASDPETRTLTLTYDVLLSDATPDDVTALPNTATFAWTTQSGGGDPQGVTDTATVTILDPVVEVAKTVDDAAAIDVVPGDEFTYRLVVTNTGNTPAYNLVITDVVPEGIVVDAATISDGGVLTGAGANGGGTITWMAGTADAEALDGPLHEQGSSATPVEIELTYDATLAASTAIDTDALVNTVTPTSWESFDEGGREYGPGESDTASVEPLFPFVEAAKAVADGDTAYEGDAFGWVLTATNTGNAAAQTVTLTDELPLNWQYTATSAITVDGVAVTGSLAPTVTGAPATGQSLQWTFGSESGAEVLPVDGVIEIRFTATPLEDALTDAGVTLPDGTAVPHTNTVAVAATDPTGAEGNAEGPYAGPDADADAYLRSADLAVDKTAADRVVAGSGEVEGWSIEVTNNGPDTAAGPIVVTDETAPLPEGIAVTGAAGEGWSCTVPVRAGDGTTTLECLRTDETESLDAGASFAEIVVSIEVDADVDVAALAADAVSNTAEVEGRTSDPVPTNNSSTDVLPIEAEADLSVVKTVTTADVLAGAPITWQIAPTNNGDSVSLSPEGDRITITDTVPAGVTDVTVTPSSPWTATAENGFPAQAGDEIVLTYAADAMPVGAAPTILVTGTIDSGFGEGDELVNTAEIAPGSTTDPDPDNNVSTVEVTPGSEATLAVAKTRVVFSGGAWVDAASLDPVPPFEAGDPVSYRIAVTNDGPADARGVQVRDEAPDGLTYASHEGLSGASWARTDGPATGDQVFGLGADLIAGATASLIVTFDSDAALEGDIVNTAVASATNGVNEPEDVDDTGSTRVADLAIEKSHTGEAIAGATLEYTLVVTNEGPSVSSGPIEIVDTLPAGMSYAADSATVAVAGGAATAVEPAEAGAQLTWSVGDASTTLGVGEQIMIVFTVDLADVMPAQLGLENVATVDGPEDPNPDNDRAADPTDIITQADMTIVKDVEAGPWVAGTEVQYQITIDNAGPSVADARIADVVPAGLSVTAMSGTGWACDVDTAVCEFDGHPVGETTIAVTALVDAATLQGSVLENVAELTWTDSRGAHSQDDPAEITVDARADLGIVKTAVDADGNPVTEVIAGDQVRYLLEVHNHGPSDAVGPIVVTDQLPLGFTFASVAASEWVCEASATVEGEVVCELDVARLAAGVTAPAITLLIDVDPAVAEGVHTNTAVVSSQTTEPDPDPNPNTDDATVDVVQRVALSVVKTHDAASVVVGGELAFEIAVSSAGPSTATGVTVTETLPAGLEYVGFEGTDWNEVSVTGDAATGTVVEYSLASAIEPGGAAPSLEVTVLVLPEAYPGVTNIVEASATQPPIDPDVPVTDDDEIVVPGLSTLVVDKTARAGAWQEGGTGSFTISLRNDGPTADPGPITVTDTMPRGLTAQSSSSTDARVECVTESGSVVCTLADGLAVGASITIVIDVAIGRGAHPAVANVVTVATPTAQTGDAVLNATASVEVAADPLANTGSSPVWLPLGALALLLMALGLWMIVIRRRREVLV